MPVIDKILEWDRLLTLAVNSFHIPWLDTVMLLATQTSFWTPLYLLLIYFIFKTQKSTAWIWIAGIAFTVLLTDQITSSWMKPYFGRLRPSHDPELKSIIHIVSGYQGGLYGFASSHAANTFGVAWFFWRFMGKADIKIMWLYGLFVWAFLMSYTRLYLGVHYLGDVLVGLFVGLVCAQVSYKLFKWVASKYKRWKVLG